MAIVGVFNDKTQRAIQILAYVFSAVGGAAIWRLLFGGCS